MSGHDRDIAREAMHRVKCELARRDVNAFCEHVMQDRTGRPWVQQGFHREWQRMLPAEGPARVLICAPRESAKSFQLVARILWELGRNRNLRIKIVTAHDDLANALVQEISTHIERNERLHEVFPALRPDPKAGWGKGRLFVRRSLIAKDPSVEGAGILTTGVGGRADLIIFDDVVDFRNAISQPALREQVKRAFVEVWTNLLGPEGRAIYMGTVWHIDDLTMMLRESGAWQVWWRPARDPVNGALLWPERWTAEALAAREREIGPRAFARQFLLEPVSDEERTFPESVLEACRDAGFAPGEVVVPEDWPRYAGVDLASSLGVRASWTVMITVAVDPETKRRYPLEIVRRRQHFPDTVLMFREQWHKHKHRLILVESNGFQGVSPRKMLSRLSVGLLFASAPWYPSGHGSYLESPPTPAPWPGGLPPTRRISPEILLGAAPATGGDGGTVGSDPEPVGGRTGSLSGQAEATQSIQPSLSNALGGALEVPERLGRAGPYHEAGNGETLAHPGLPSVVAMEVEGRPQAGGAGDPATDPPPEQGESAVGSGANPGRAAANGLRGPRGGHGPQVYGEAQEAAVSLDHLADIPEKPSPLLLGDRLLHRHHAGLSGVVCLSGFRSCPTRGLALRHHPEPLHGVGDSATARGDPVWMPAAVSFPGQ